MSEQSSSNCDSSGGGNISSGGSGGDGGSVCSANRALLINSNCPDANTATAEAAEEEEVGIDRQARRHRRSRQSGVDLFNFISVAEVAQTSSDKVKN